MSGGHFDYIQFRLNNNVIPLIEAEISRGQWNSSTIAELIAGVRAIRQASVYIHRIDWLLSGDDSEDGFAKKLKKDLEDGCNG